jgi:hypothetical protein
MKKRKLIFIYYKDRINGKPPEMTRTERWETSKEVRERIREEKQRQERRYAPYKEMTKKQLIDKILKMKDQVEDLAYKIGDFEDRE